MGWKMPECKSTKMCKHSERPQGSSIGITSVGNAVSMKAEKEAAVTEFEESALSSKTASKTKQLTDVFSAHQQSDHFTV